jgi:hypothetical protein
MVSFLVTKLAGNPSLRGQLSESHLWMNEVPDDGMEFKDDILPK